jgi:hypothetical protein
VVLDHLPRVLAVEGRAGEARHLGDRRAVLGSERGGRRDAGGRGQLHEFLVGARVVVDHALAELLDGVARAALCGEAAEFDLHHPARRRLHHELAVVGAELHPLA